jgi:hypothetical protein
MRSWAVRILSAVGIGALSVTMFGAGVASASDGLTGKTFGEASSAIASKDGNAVVGTVMGSELAMDDCIVVSWHVSHFLNSSGKNDRKKDFIFNLNCNNPLAAPGKPGNSLMSPAGEAAKKDQAAAATIDKNPEWCQTSDQRMRYCERVCKSTKLCTV